MEDQKKKARIKKAAVIVGSAAATVAGVLVIPTVINKLSSKLYKESIGRKPIDFDNMGPEIVRKEPQQENNEEE